MSAHVVVISLHADPATHSGTGTGGGTHAYLRELLAGMAAQGRRLTLITRRTSASLPAETRVSRYTSVLRAQIGALEPIDKRLLHGMHPLSLASVSQLVEALEPRATLLHSVYWNSGRVAMELSARLGLSFVHTVISNGYRRQQEGATSNADERIAVEGRVFNAAAQIFSVSEAERDDLVHFYGVDPSRIVVVGRPVNPWFLNPAHDEMGNPTASLLEAR